ncbi:DMT family transporter [Cytobacillus praedii]|uniref:DMT family transporter n=1 Tax=Cytobacillus praedii TaxID=1742358 RepID=A0A4R1AN99_9BACI|nr:DMT family transporter [Cytobacillus praedii]TCJ01297.1 DMT family transporter [Cytobacillus praedii]
MKGILFAVMAGVFISLQTVFNTRVSGKVGLWATTTLVLGLGFFTSFLMFIIMDDTRLFAVGNVNKVYLFGGFLGVGVVFCIMQAIRMLGPAYAISIVLVSQIFLAVLIDTFGWFGFETISFTMNKLVGLALMIAGIIVFKLKQGKRINAQKEQIV